MESCLDLKEFYKVFPLVRLFCYKNILYAYDSKSNLLVEVDEKDIRNLLEFSTHKEDACCELHIYNKFLTNGVFLPGRAKRVTPREDDILKMYEEYMLDIIPRKFIIEVTQNCNLRCKYCLYSDKSSIRSHNIKTMPEDVAKKAIDFYFKIYTDTIKDLPRDLKKTACSLAVPTLSWWGGEPFLNFELIKTTKVYFESLPWEAFGISKNELSYTLVTNLTIFSQEILDFVVDNNVYLFVSLDGDKAEHDSNRVYKNNIGTFNEVYKNINTIIDQYPEYSRKRIGLQSVRADNIDVAKAANYLHDNFAEKILSCVSYQQRYWDNKNIRKYCIDDYVIDEKRYDRLFDYLEEKPEVETRKYLDSSRETYLFFKNVIGLEQYLSFDNPRGSDFHERMFSCPIGKDGIFCSADGKLHMCNKTDYTSPIGDLDKGIIKENILKIFQDYYKLLNSKCTSCWAFRFCKMCPALALEKNKFEAIGEDYCIVTRNEIKAEIYCYIALSSHHRVHRYLSRYCHERAVRENSFLTYEGPVSINFLIKRENEKNKETATD